METTLRLIRAIARLALPCLALQSSSVLIAARDEPIALTSVGAVGDNRADDTQALQSAFGAAGGRCLDGEGRTYRVRGSLRVDVAVPKSASFSLYALIGDWAVALGAVLALVRSRSSK